MSRITRDVEVLSAAAAEAERAAVLAEIDEDADDLRTRLADEGLTGWEMSVLAELDALEDRLSA